MVTDATLRAQLGALSDEAWWAKRRDSGIHGPEDLPRPYHIAMRLAEAIGQVPVLILVCSITKGVASMTSVIPAVENLLLAARALGIG